MKKWGVFLLINLICVVYSLYGVELNYNCEIYGSLQVNHPTYSQVTSTPSRIRFELNTITSNKSYYFTTRIIGAGGRAYFGSPTSFVPANDVAGDQSLYVEYGKDNVLIDQAFFACKVMTKMNMFVGLIDPFTFHKGKGFTYSQATLNENMGFISPHFLKLYANNGLDQVYFISIPSLFFVHEFSDNLIIRYGITAGLTDTHIFVRNSFPAEIDMTLFNKTSHFVINFGFADADSSFVHKVSPSVGIIWDQKIIDRLCFFAKASRIFKDIKTWKTPANNFNDDYKVAKEFSEFMEHFNCGLTFGCDRIYSGCGISYLKSMLKGTPEKNIELFVRFKLDDSLYLTPDSQIILNPSGNKEDKSDLLWLGALRLFYSF